MQSSLQFIGDDDRIRSNRKHTVFVQSQKEAQNFDVAEHFKTSPELAGRTFNRPWKDTILNDNKPDKNTGDRKPIIHKGSTKPMEEPKAPEGWNEDTAIDAEELEKLD